MSIYEESSARELACLVSWHYQAEPWRNIAALEMRSPFEWFWVDCPKPIVVCCLTVNIPELSVSEVTPALRRTLRAFRSPVNNGLDIGFLEFLLPKLDESERGARFRILLFGDGNIIRNGFVMRDHFADELEKELPGVMAFLTINDPPGKHGDGAFIAYDDDADFVELMDWLYINLADSEYRYSGTTWEA